jgi:hypothetical protein
VGCERFNDATDLGALCHFMGRVDQRSLEAGQLDFLRPPRKVVSLAEFHIQERQHAVEAGRPDEAGTNLLTALSIPRAGLVTKDRANGGIRIDRLGTRGGGSSVTGGIHQPSIC